MDWSYSPKASQQHHTTSLNREPRGAKEKKATEKQAVLRFGSRKLETVAEIFWRPECLVESCWRPMQQEGRRRLWLINWNSDMPHFVSTSTKTFNKNAHSLEELGKMLHHAVAHTVRLADAWFFSPQEEKKRQMCISSMNYAAESKSRTPNFGSPR